MRADQCMGEGGGHSLACARTKGPVFKTMFPKPKILKITLSFRGHPLTLQAFQTSCFQLLLIQNLLMLHYFQWSGYKTVYISNQQINSEFSIFNTVELQYSRIQYSRKLQYSRRFGGDQGFLFNKNPKQQKSKIVELFLGKVA